MLYCICILASLQIFNDVALVVAYKLNDSTGWLEKSQFTPWPGLPAPLVKTAFKMP